MQNQEEDYHNLREKYQIMISEHEHDEDQVRKLKQELDDCKDELIGSKREY
jgi:molybdate-binding protein